MLSDTLRAGAESRVFKIVLFVIILSFIFTGVGGYLIPRLNTDPVTVGDYKISAQEWTNQYNQQTQMIQRRYGAQGVALLENPEYVKKLRQGILEGMIDNVAFNSAVYESNVRIGDEQIKDVIRNTPAFFKDGKFSNDLYIATVRNMGMSPEYYGEQMRLSLMASAVSDPIVKLAGQALPYEIDNLLKIMREVRVVDLYALDLDSVKKNTQVTDAEVRDFYDNNNKSFMKPASSKFNYVILDMSALASTVEKSDSAIEEYYNMHNDEFRVGQKRGAYHLVVTASDKDKESKIKAIEEDIKNGVSFVEIAKKFNIDKSTVDLGMVSHNQIAPNLEEALFNLAKEGDVSAPIVDDYGTHYIAMYKLQEEYTPALAEIKDKVTTAYVNAKSRELFSEKAQTLSDISYENPDSLDPTAQALGLEVLDSGEVSFGDSSAKWPLNTKEVQDAAFAEENITSNVNSSVINVSDSVAVVINVYEHHESSLIPFDEVKDKAYDLALEAKASAEGNKILETYAKELVNDPNAKAPENVVISPRTNVAIVRGDETFSSTFGLQIYAIDTFEKNGYVIGNNANKPTLAILRDVKENTSVEEDLFRNIIKAELAQEAQYSTATLLRQGARELTEITYNEDAIKLVNEQNPVEE